MTSSIFVTCLPGLECYLEQEIQELGYVPQLGKGGVYIHSASFRDVLVLNLHLRTASRVLWHLFDVPNPTRQRLYDKVLRANWDDLFRSMPSFSIDVPFAVHRDFSSTLYVAQLVKDAICDNLRKKFGARPSIDTKEPDVMISVAIEEDVAHVSWDTSGAPLFKRGYRPDGIEAPIKETLAAALLMASGFQAGVNLFDPCSGSGTFLIEAALMATKTAPGLFREQYAFFRHPLFDLDQWQEVKKAAQQQILPITGTFTGCECSHKAHRVALRAVARAGFSGSIAIECREFQTMTFSTAPNFVITNPPFGIRLQEDNQLIQLYTSIGYLLKHKTSKPAKGGVLISGSSYARAIGLHASRKLPVSHGGLDCLFYIYDLYDGRREDQPVKQECATMKEE